MTQRQRVNTCSGPKLQTPTKKKVQRSSFDVFTVPFEQVNIFHVSKLLVETRERYQQRPLLFPKFLLTRFYFV